jgi:hypothetical protein
MYLSIVGDVALHSLTTCDADDGRFIGSISRLALTDDTDSSKAVLQSLLALSSLHRHGVQPEAIRLQSEALKLLDKSARNGLSEQDVIQHIAAGMLLCTFEVRQSLHTTLYRSRPLCV